MIEELGPPQEAEALEAQRVFLLRSLDDLESEREVGNIDDETYARLHGDYTARAAAVLRAIEGEPVELTPGPPPVSAGRRALVVGGLIAFAVAAAVVLAVTIAPRQSGQTVTGGVATPSSAGVLKAAVQAHPNDYSARIQYARSLLGTDSVGALEQYSAAARLNPTDPEPPTYIGWIVGLASQKAPDATARTQLLDRSLAAFKLAHKLDPKYPDAYVFEGLVRAEFANDPAGAIPLLQHYLKLAPDGPEATAVRTTLKQAQKAAAKAAETKPEASTTPTTH